MCVRRRPRDPGIAYIRGSISSRRMRRDPDSTWPRRSVRAADGRRLLVRKETSSGRFQRGKFRHRAVAGKLQSSGKSLVDVENVLQKDVMFALRKRTYDFIPGTDVKNRAAQRSNKANKAEEVRPPATASNGWRPSPAPWRQVQISPPRRDTQARSRAGRVHKTGAGEPAADAAAVATAANSSAIPSDALSWPLRGGLLVSRGPPAKNYAESDKKRDQLKAMGVETEDLADGTTT